MPVSLVLTGRRSEKILLVRNTLFGESNSQFWIMWPPCIARQHFPVSNGIRNAYRLDKTLLFCSGRSHSFAFQTNVCPNPAHRPAVAAGMDAA
jgi:hypothetical protein